MSTSDTPWRNPAASTEPVAESAALMQRVLFEVKRMVVGQDAFLERVAK